MNGGGPVAGFKLHSSLLAVCVGLRTAAADNAYRERETESCIVIMIMLIIMIVIVISGLLQIGIMDRIIQLKLPSSLSSSSSHTSLVSSLGRIESHGLRLESQSVTLVPAGRLCSTESWSQNALH